MIVPWRVQGTDFPSQMGPHTSSPEKKSTESSVIHFASLLSSTTLRVIGSRLVSERRKWVFWVVGATNNKQEKITQHERL